MMTPSQEMDRIYSDKILRPRLLATLTTCRTANSPLLGTTHHKATSNSLHAQSRLAQCQLTAISNSPVATTTKVSGSIRHSFYSTTRGSQSRSHSFSYLHITPLHACLYLVSVHETALPLTCDGIHLIAAYCSSIDPERMNAQLA